MDAGTWRGIFTLVMLILFVALCFWAWSSKRKADFDEASQLPFSDDEPKAGGNGQ